MCRLKKTALSNVELGEGGAIDVSRVSSRYQCSKPEFVVTMELNDLGMDVDMVGMVHGECEDRK